MTAMTDAEAEALDRELTETTPEIDFNKPGFFAKQQGMVVAMDPVSSAFLRAQSESTQKTPAEIIGLLIRKEIAASA